MVGEIVYIVGIAACVVSGVCGVVTIVNEYKRDSMRPNLKCIKKHEIRILFTLLLFSIAYAYAIALYARHFMFLDRMFLNSTIFELRTSPVTICVVALAWRMVIKVFRWIIGLEKDLTW